MVNWLNIFEVLKCFQFSFSIDCECNQDGSSSTSCTNEGICSCNAGVEGDRCSRCIPNYFGFPTCKGE